MEMLLPEKIHSFLSSLGNDLSLDQKLVVFNIMEKKESIKDLANGRVTLFCTPEDVNLNMAAFGSIDNKHAEMLAIQPVPTNPIVQPRPLNRLPKALEDDNIKFNANN